MKERNHQIDDSEDVCQEETMCENSVCDERQNQSGEPVMNCEIVNTSRSNVFIRCAHKCVVYMYTFTVLILYITLLILERLPSSV